MSTPTVLEPTPVALPAPSTPVAQALAQLFRHSLRDGRVHPLLHVVRRHRLESPR